MLEYFEVMLNTDKNSFTWIALTKKVARRINEESLKAIKNTLPNTSRNHESLKK